MPVDAPFAGVAPGQTVAAKLVTMTHANRYGQRDYRLYIPTTRPRSRRPLIVMLPGCTQRPADIAAGPAMNGLAERHGFLVAYPAQPPPAEAIRCWKRFKADDQRRAGGEPALIAGLVRDILRDHLVDPARIYVAGLSACDAAAAIVAAAYPDLFRTDYMQCGPSDGAATDFAQAFAAWRNGCGEGACRADQGR